MITAVFRLFDILRGPLFFQLLWHLLTKVSRLTEQEIQVASIVLGSGAIRYGSVRVAEGRILRLIFRLNRSRAFTVFHTINLPPTGRHSRKNIDLVVHELIHAYQFETVGSVYIWQALRAQKTNGYQYGGWSQLVDDWANGSHFRDYNREQQGQIAQDYYSDVVAKGLPPTDPIYMAFEPLINELKAGDL